jgi:hypothetical protein
MVTLWTKKQCEWTPPRLGNPSYISKARLKDSSQFGVVTTEFIFSFLIASGLSIALFALTYTLLVVETLQYVSFSVARAQIASHLTPQKQMEVGRKKYQSLTQGDSAIARIFKSSWFEIDSPDEILIRQGQSGEGTGGAKDFSQDLGGGGSNPHMRFQGVSIRFLPKILNFKLLSLGSTNPDEDPATFETRLNTMLIREPSQSECREFFKTKAQVNSWRDLLEGQNFSIEPQDFGLFEDNGC